MTNEMPKKLWAISNGSGRMCVVDGGYPYVKPTRYPRLAPDDIVISRAELEGMRHSEEEMDKEADCEVSFYSMGGYNDLIEELLARIK